MKRPANTLTPSNISAEITHVVEPGTPPVPVIPTTETPQTPVKVDTLTR